MNKKLKNVLLIIAIIYLSIFLLITLIATFAVLSISKAESLCLASVSALLFILIIKCIKCIKNTNFSNKKIIRITSIGLIVLSFFCIPFFPKIEKTQAENKNNVQNMKNGKNKKEVQESNKLSDNDRLKSELKEKYEIGIPSEFANGDKTGKWRIVKIANSAQPSDYAVTYAQAYMKDGDIHYIVNFSLKTTTMLRLLNGIIDVKTTEYVKKEELDATIIGKGKLYKEQHFYVDTGKEITIETDTNAGIVTKDDLISKVKEVIAGSIGSGEKITNVNFEGKNLTVTVDLSGTDTKLVTSKDIAWVRISSITDSILELDDQYYNTWNSITIDFGKEGKAVLDKGMIKNQGYGKFFDFPNDILK